MSRRRLPWLLRFLAPTESREDYERPADDRPVSVLLLTEDRDVNDRFDTMAAKFGHEISTFDNFPGAIEEVGQRSPDLAVIDWRLPAIRGPETVDDLRRSAGAPALPIMALVTDDSASTMADIVGHGIDDYLVLPMDGGHAEMRLLLLTSRVEAIRGLTRSHQKLR